MTFLFGKKTLSSLALFVAILITTNNVMAIDAAFILPEMLIFHDPFMASKKVASAGFLALPFLPVAILDENTKTITVNGNDLIELGYTSEEISLYQNDLNSIKNLLTSNKFSSMDEVQQALISLDLGVIAKEQFRIQ